MLHPIYSPFLIFSIYKFSPFINMTIFYLLGHMGNEIFLIYVRADLYKEHSVLGRTVT
jgi:hypothetical protein